MNRMKLPLLLVKSGYITLFVGVTLLSFFSSSPRIRPARTTPLLAQMFFQIVEITSVCAVGIGILLLFAAATTYVRARRTLIAALHTSAGMLCPRCEYNLHGLPSVGDCPECGTHYTHEALQRAWRGMK